MKTATPKQKQIIIAISIICTIVILGFCYLLFTNIGHNSNNLAIKDRILKITYQDKDYLTDLEKHSLKSGLKINPIKFSIVNNGTMAMAYKIYLNNPQLTSFAEQIYISLDGQTAQLLSSYKQEGGGYLIKSDVINATNNDLDYEEFNIRIWLDEKATVDFEGQIKIKITSEVAMNLATDLLYAMSYTNNNNGLSLGSDMLPKYTGIWAENHLMFNNELWRILGISKVRADNEHELLDRVLIVKDEPIAASLWYQNKNHLVWEALTAYQTKISKNDQLYIAPVIWSATEQPKLFNVPSATDYSYMSAWVDKTKPFWIYDATDEKVYTINNSGITEAYDNDKNYILPTVYLKPTARIISGEGTIKNPYRIY